MDKSARREERPTITILPSTAAHVRELADKLRAADRRELEMMYGFPPHKTLWHSFKGSFIRRTAFINGNLAAMWGVGGSPMGSVGNPWLMTTDEVFKISSLSFARIYQQEILRMLKIFPVLINYVDAEYGAAIRLLDIIGFTLEEPQTKGTQGALFRKFEMRA